VKLVHLNHADAATVVGEISRIFPSQDVRIVADKRTNSVIMVAPPATEEEVANLIAKLDVPQATIEGRPSRSDLESEVIHLEANNPINPDRVADALGKLVSSRLAKGQGSTIAVVRASPAVQKALEEVFQPPTYQPGKGQPGKGQQGKGQQGKGQPYQVWKPLSDDRSVAGSPDQRIEVLRLSAQQAAALRKALTGTLPSKGPKPGVIVVAPTVSPSVAPTEAKNQESPATGSKNAPPTLR
jgi:hypothetical protein